jgi:hypothetical protein
MENQQNLQNENENLTLNAESLNYLSETRKWTMFFAILGFIGIGFMVLGAFFMGIVSSVGGAFGGMQETWILGVISIVYLAMAGLYVFPVLYLMRFSTKIKSAVETSDQNNLAIAFQNLKSHFKYMGILTISIIGLYILAIFVFLIVGATSFF